MSRRVLWALVLACAGCTTTPAPKLSNPQPERASDINLELGIDYFRKGNLAAAKEKIDRALEQNPKNAKAQAAAGLLYDRLNDPKKSESHFDKALAADPNNPDILNNYAAVLCKHGKHAKGEKYFAQAAGNPLYKTPEIAYLNAGNCARVAGDDEAAEANYRTALTIKPKFPDALYQMADLEFQKQSYMSARGFIERYMEAGRTNAAILWLALRIEKSLGNSSGVSTYAQRLKLEYPSSPETQQLLESERKPG